VGADIWVDIKSILPGMNWPVSIQYGLDVSDIMLVIISSDAMESKHVHDEWKYFAKKKKPIIPILWHQTENIPKELSERQHINFINQSYEVARDILIAALKAHGMHLSGALKQRDELPTITKLAAHARDISILSVTSASFADGNHYDGFLENMVAKNCTVNMILLDSSNEVAIKNWAVFCERGEDHVIRQLEQIKIVINRVQADSKFQGKLNIRYLDFFFPFNLFGVNLNADNTGGPILLGYYGFGQAVGAQRPHILLTRHDEPKWFEFYRNQFNAAWKTARELS
jgi:hypothetical protein